jgi:hypothetical protein
MSKLRLAKVWSANTEEVAQYLPSNYMVIGFNLEQDHLLIAGVDNQGWTLEDYVIPRLGSGLLHCEVLCLNETMTELTELRSVQ